MPLQVAAGCNAHEYRCKAGRPEIWRRTLLLLLAAAAAAYLRAGARSLAGALGGAAGSLGGIAEALRGALRRALRLARCAGGRVALPRGGGLRATRLRLRSRRVALPRRRALLRCGLTVCLRLRHCASPPGLTGWSGRTPYGGRE